jgi:hypothetical protein
MIDPQTQKQPNARAGERQKAFSNASLTPDTTPSQDQIRARAHELYEGRGCESGQQEQDWLQAEREMRSAAQAGLGEEL